MCSRHLKQYTDGSLGNSNFSTIYLFNDMKLKIGQNKVKSIYFAIYLNSIVVLYSLLCNYLVWYTN